MAGTTHAELANQLGARRGTRVRRGVRSAKEWSISTSRTVPGARIIITSRLRLFPLGLVGGAVLKPNLVPGQQGSRPRDLLYGQAPEKPKTTLPVLRRGGAGCQRKSFGFGASEAKELAASFATALPPPQAGGDHPPCFRRRRTGTGVSQGNTVTACGYRETVRISHGRLVNVFTFTGYIRDVEALHIVDNNRPVL